MIGIIFCIIQFISSSKHKEPTMQIQAHHQSSSDLNNMLTCCIHLTLLHPIRHLRKCFFTIWYLSITNHTIGLQGTLDSNSLRSAYSTGIPSLGPSINLNYLHIVFVLFQYHNISFVLTINQFLFLSHLIVVR